MPTFPFIILSFLVICMLLILVRISIQLESITRINILQLAFNCNSELMLRASNADKIFRNAFKLSQEYQADPARKSRVFLSRIRHIINP